MSTKNPRPPADSNGTVGRKRRGQKPNELRKVRMHGVITQGECSGHEDCGKGKCAHRKVER